MAFKAIIEFEETKDNLELDSNKKKTLEAIKS